MSFLPSTEHGYLPYFLLYTSFAAFVHGLVTYLRPLNALPMFRALGPLPPAPATLLAHVYGDKNMHSALIRFYAMYHITNPQVYDLALATFALVLLFNLGEWAVWKTVGSKEFLWPAVTGVKN